MELSKELDALLANGLHSPAEKVALLRFFRLNRGAVWCPQLVSFQGSQLRALGESAVGEDYWSILEQTLASALHCGRIEEAHACLAALQVRFGIFMHAKPSEVEGEAGTPQSGSLRVHFLELLVQEWQALHGGEESGGRTRVGARGGAHSGSSGGGGSGGAQLATSNLAALEKSAKKDYAELAELRPTGGGASGTPTGGPAAARRLAVLDSTPRAALVRLLDTHLGDAPSWQELAELCAKDGAASLPQAIHCYEELVLLAPNQAGWHARLADLHAALHAPSIAGEHALTALRQARLHAAEAVRLSEGSVAYAVAALADAAYLHAAAVLAAGAAPPRRSAAIADELRLLPGCALGHMVRSLTDLSKGASPERAAAALAQPPAAITLPAAMEPARARALEESLALHALAVHYFSALRSGEAGVHCKAMEGKAPLPHALCGPQVGAGQAPAWLQLFPALAVEGALLTGAHAAQALAAQAAYLKAVAAALARAASE